MPFLAPDQATQSSRRVNEMISAAELDITGPQPTFSETAAAAFRQENVTAAIFGSRNMTTQDLQIDRNHNPLDFIKDTDYETFNLGRFTGSANEAETRRIMARIDQETKDRDTISASGGSGVAMSFAAGVVDLPNVLPGGQVYRSVKGGVSVLKRARSTAVAGTAAAAAAEAVLQQTQELRTVQESLFNIGASALLSGVLGAGAAGLSAKEFGRASRAMEDLTQIPESAADDVYGGGGDAFRSVGAAGALPIAEVEGAFGVEKVARLADPTLRLATMKSQRGRNTGAQLAENALWYRDNAEGIAVVPGGAVDTRVTMYNARLATALDEMDTAFNQHYFGRQRVPFGRLRAGVNDLIGQTPDLRMSYTEFKEAVGQAMRENDVHQVPEVEQAAKAWRKRVFEPAKNDAIELGLLPEDIDPVTAQSYLMRVYNKEKIIAQRDTFKAKTVNYLQRTRDEAGVLASQRQADLAAVQTDIEGIRSQIRGLVSTRDTGARELRVKAAKAEGKTKQQRKAVRKAETAARQAERRVEDLTPTEIADAVDRGYYSKLLRDVTKGTAPVRTLLQDIRAMGGIKDTGGEVRSLIGNRTGLIRDNGISPDVLVRRLHDEGYFQDEFGPAGAFDDIVDERDTDVLFDAIQRDSAGDRVVSEQNRPDLEHAEFVEELSQKIGKDEFDFAQATPESLRAFLTGGKFKADTPNIRGKLSESRRNFSRRVNDVISGQKEFDSLEDAAASLSDAQFVMRQESPAITKRISDLRKAVSENVALRRTGRKDLAIQVSRGAKTDVELASRADEIIDRIIGGPDGRTAYDAEIADGFSSKTGGSGGNRAALNKAFQQRAFLIPDREIQDFLESDIEVVGRIYNRGVASDIEMIRRFGSVDMERQFKEMAEEFNILIGKAATDKQRNKLQAEKDEAIRDMAGVRDRIRGIYGLPSNPQSIMTRSFNVVRNTNYLRLLGGMTISAIPDMARPVMTQGIARTMGDGLIPLMRNFRAFKASAQEIKLAGTALDMMLDTRTMAIADVMEDFGRGSKFERAVHGAAAKFGLVSLMAPWNAAMKQFSGVIVLSRILQNAELMHAGKLTDAGEIRAMARLNIDEAAGRKIWQQFLDHGGEKTEGVFLPNTHGWTDRTATEALRGALVKEVDRIIVTPGQERPLLLSTKEGKVIGQFRSFAFASSQKVLVSGLQQRDMAVLNGAIMMMMLGGLSYSIKQKQRGREVSDNPRVFLAEAFDHSGLAGWFMEVNNMAAKLTRGRVSLSGEPMSRFASRNLVASLLGPSVGLIEDFRKLTGDISTGEMTESTTRTARRLLPLQNVFYIRSLLNQMESNVNEAFGILERAN